MELKLWRKTTLEKTVMLKRVIMMSLMLICINTSLSLLASPQQSKIVKGTVTDENKEPLIGVSVMVSGTSTGTVTDLDGNYSIDASKGTSLVFSYVGYDKIERRIPDSGSLNVAMQSSSIALKEVMVTAMGVRAEKKKLNFAVQSLDNEQVTAGQYSNFAKTLQGKIAGVLVSSTGGAATATTQIIIRSISSINPGQSNEPLIILDGMPVAGGGTAMGDINPNDIENVTVLKGAAAAALYGQDAANGAIMITTKNGQAGKMVVTGNASVQFDFPKTYEIQQMYGPGAAGFHRPLTMGGWGPLIQPGETIYDNIGNYFRTGIYQKYDVNASGGTDKFKAYASANYSANEGVVPENYKNMFGLLVKGSYDISKTVNLSLQSNYIETQSRGASIDYVYSWPINDDMRNYRNNDGTIRWLYDQTIMDSQERIDATVNPYWSRYEDSGQNKSSRNILQGSLEWKPVKGLSLSAKLSYDRKYSSYDGYITPRYRKSDFPNIDILDENGKKTGEAEDPVIQKNPSKFGQYLYQPSNSSLMTTQFLGNYNFKVHKDLELGILAGFEMKDIQGVEATMGGAGFVLPGEFYSMQNIEYVTSDVQYEYGLRLYHYNQNKFGYFGEIRLDYKGIANLSVTGRNDMSSTLTQKSYFYPSVTAGITFSELFNIHSDIFSYGKIRGNWAKVGKDGPRYKFDRNFKQWSTFPDGGFGLDATVGSANNLDPEMTSSWEIGADLRFFHNKTKLDIVYYSTTVNNQIVTVRVSPASGMILQTRNEGAISNHGMEIEFTQDILSNKDFKWTAGINYSFNRGRVDNLPDQLTEIQGTQYGDIFPTAFLHGSTTALVGRDYMRNPDGKILCRDDGTPIIDPSKSVLIGDREPDFLMGLTNTFVWKDLSLSFLIEGRKGGDVANIASRSLFSNGQSKALEKYRNREIIIDGVVQQPDGSYVPNTKPIIFNERNMNSHFNVSSNFIEDGSYIRLTYVTLAYSFDRFLKRSPVKSLKLAATGQNLFLFTKYTGADPQISAGSASGTGSFGIDNLGIANVRSVNFTLSATF